MDLTWLYISLYALLLLIAGYFLPFNKDKRMARMYAWIIALVTVVVSAVLTSAQSPLTRMVVIVVLQLLSMLLSRRFVLITKEYLILTYGRKKKLLSATRSVSLYR